MKSSTVVLIILLLVVAAGIFIVGTQYFSPTPALVTGVDVTPVSSSTDPYADTTAWQTYANAAFTIKYPADFDSNEVHNGTSTDWRLNAGSDPGMLDFTLTIPKAFEPSTNFSDAKLTVGESSNAAAVDGCLAPDASGGPGASMTTRVINGTTFTVFTFSDAGAGNLYDSTSYRTVHMGKCYALEYTIHSTQLANYPPEAGVKQFDEARVRAVLDRIAGTFSFR
jgi:hypothetical protein